MEITILEVNLDNPSFSAKAPFSGERLGGESESETDDGFSTGDAETDESGRSPLPFVVGLVFLVGIGLAVRRLRGGDSDPVEETETEPIAA